MSDQSNKKFGEEVKAMSDEELCALVRKAVAAGMGYGEDARNGACAPRLGREDEKEEEPLALKVDRAMGWRRYTIDVMVYSALVCALLSFGCSINAWYTDRGLWSVVGWFFASMIFFAMSFLGWCIMESTIEAQFEKQQKQKKKEMEDDEDGD